MEDLERTLGQTLDIQEYDSLFEMLDALKDNTIGAIILNVLMSGLLLMWKDTIGQPQSCGS